MPPRPLARRIWSALAPTLRYWMQTEVHVFAFSIAANVLLALFPFLIICVSLGALVFDRGTVVDGFRLAFEDLFPIAAMSGFLERNLPYSEPVSLLSIFILLFSANGIFEPLEVALNHIWGIHKNRTFLRNQLVSLGLIFSCGSLALFSLTVAAIRGYSVDANPVEKLVARGFFKAASVPLTVLALYLVYRYLPNGRPPVKRVLPAAIVVGVLLEALKTINTFVWPRFDAKLQHEYGVFRYSATLIFLSFLTSMLVLGGAEWAARGHRMDQELDKAAAK